MILFLNLLIQAELKRGTALFVSCYKRCNNYLKL